jgi:hypothetical protein
MSRPGEASAQSVKRTESAPCVSISSSGSSTLPLDLLILAPLASRTRPWITTWRNGTSPSMKCSPIIIIRATQKKMMSKPVTSTSVG